MFKKRLCMALTSLIVLLTVVGVTLKTRSAGPIDIDQLAVTHTYTYVEAEAQLDSTDPVQEKVLTYIDFLQDPSYSTTNDSQISALGLANTTTFVNSEFEYQPSLFASLRNVDASILSEDRKVLWLGYNNTNGLDVVNLDDNHVKSFAASALTGGRILLLVGNDDTSQVFVITEDGVTEIKVQGE